MAYFPNGTAGMMYEEKYCSHCAHMPEDIDGGCPIWDMHYLHNRDQCGIGKTAKAIKNILDMLIPSDKEGFPEECKMFTPRQPADADYTKHLLDGKAPLEFEGVQL